MPIPCMIVLAGLCLPLETQDVEITAHTFGATATARLGEVEVIWELETDALGVGGAERACVRDACVRFTRRPDLAQPGAAFRIQVENSRGLNITAPDRRTLKAALAKMSFIAEGLEGPVAVPLSAFAR